MLSIMYQMMISPVATPDNTGTERKKSGIMRNKQGDISPLIDSKACMLNFAVSLHQNTTHD